MRSIGNIVTKYIALLLLSTLFIAACKSSNSVSKKSDKSQNQKDSLSEKNQILFTSFFIEGCRERMKGNFELAESRFKDCLRLDPKSAAVKYELGNLYRLNGLYDNAMKYAKECANAEPKNEWYQLLLIDCLHNKDLYAQAADVYSRLIKNYPTHPEYYEGLAAEYMYNGNYEKSFKRAFGLFWRLFHSTKNSIKSLLKKELFLKFLVRSLSDCWSDIRMISI